MSASAASIAAALAPRAVRDEPMNSTSIGVGSW